MTNRSTSPQIGRAYVQKIFHTTNQIHVWTSVDLWFGFRVSVRVSVSVRVRVWVRFSVGVSVRVRVRVRVRYTPRH